ncbi:MAG: response regulator transcription factor [Bacilli bacterium]|nr:response regulator transcription factor [Bacilli bacterium]
MMINILIADTNEELKKGLEYDFKQQGYSIKLCDDGMMALNEIKNNRFDLVIIDLDLPSLGGIELIQKIKEVDVKIRVIVLTNRDDEMDIVLGLENGANDYITKPFSPRVLLARVKVALRELTTMLEVPSIIKINDDLVLDNNSRNAYLNDEQVNLSKLEFDLIVYLVINCNRVVTRNELMKNIWNYEFDSKNRIIDVYAHSLRNKLNLKDQLLSKRGIGYIFVERKKTI